MKLLLSRSALPGAAVVTAILLSGHQVASTMVAGRYWGAALALLAFAAGIAWQRVSVRKTVARDASQAMAGLATVMATLLRETATAVTPPPQHDVASPSRDVVRVRTLFVSDAHLGTRGSQAELLLACLRRYEAETVFMVGDMLDGWRLNADCYWPQAHQDVVQELLDQARRGVRLVYLPGNHDDFLRAHAGSAFGGIDLVDHAIHHGADGRDYLVIHGDQFDVVMRRARWLALVGDWAYRTALVLNAGLNRVRARCGLPYWSFSAWAKASVKKAVNHIGHFEQELCAAAQGHNVQGVICGHIHHPMMHDSFGVRYINTGDWVESCSAVVEHSDGRFEIIHWPRPQHQRGAAMPAAAPLAKAA
ncbi:MAG: UDP-2,3-diacylglucosamine diphosphatase [Pseudomonadota bacterium]